VKLGGCLTNLKVFSILEAELMGFYYGEIINPLFCISEIRDT
jgi:hypothetical protein